MNPASSPSINGTRFSRFVAFFSGYLAVWSVLAAALPIPASLVKLIPVYNAQSKSLALYTSLFCFLLLGFLFYSRHTLARWMFPKKSDRASSRISRLIAWLPFVCIVACFACVLLYQYTLDRSIKDVMQAPFAVAQFELIDELLQASDRGNLSAKEMREMLQERVKEFGTWNSSNEVLQQVDGPKIPYRLRLMLLYLAIFLLAESAFALMALKEHLQDLLGLSDLELIESNKEPKHPRSTR